MKSTILTSSSIAIGLLATAADGDVITLLDVVGQSNGGIVWSSAGEPSSFVVSSEHMRFSANNWATHGNVYTFDTTSGMNQPGSIFITAREGWKIRVEGMDISGWSEYFASAKLRLLADGEPIHAEDFSLTGSAETAHPRFEEEYASVYEIKLDNLVNVGIGLDNIEISSMAVPAPAALAMFGVAGMGFNRRRRA